MKGKLSYLFDPEGMTDEEEVASESFAIYLESAAERMVELPRALRVGFLKRAGYVSVLYDAERDELVHGAARADD